MKVSIDWLEEHIDLSNYNDSEISDLLTFSGIEVEGIIKYPDKVIVAEIAKIEKHPNADKLQVCQVNDGEKTPRQIVCGAKNFSIGDKVPLALPGASMMGGFEIKEAKLRGVESKGMLCSQAELGGHDSDGLWILPSGHETGKPLNKIYPTVFDLEITPNRPDCLSHIGVARELAAVCKKSLKNNKNYEANSDSIIQSKTEDIYIEDSQLCPLYTLRKIENVKIGPSPQWLQSKLESIGLRPINNVVDITNYVMMEMGQPLHAFDSGKISGSIKVRKAKQKEIFKALDDNEYELQPDDLVISDKNEALALAGIMGGANSGVTENTQAVFIESAHFNQSEIRKSSKRLNLSSDSSYRFERGTDPAQVIKASAIATHLIEELAGGKTNDEIIICGNINFPSRNIPMRLDKCRKILGCNIENEKMTDILGNLGIKAQSHEEGTTQWSIPSFRNDLTRPEDLYEEIARILGIEKIPSIQRGWFSEPSDADKLHDFVDHLSNKLSSIGFHETRSLKLISKSQIGDCFCCLNDNAIALKNPLSDDLTHLRPGLIASLLSIAERNIHQGAEALRLYESGTVFAENNEIEEFQNIALLISGPQNRSWLSKNPPAPDFFSLSGIIERLIGENIIFSPSESNTENTIINCEIILKDSTVGKAAQLSPAKTRKMDATFPIYIAELNLAKIMEKISIMDKFTELPKFPAIRRDISMELPLEITNNKIISTLNEIDLDILESFELFDYFHDESGEKLNSEKKSLAYSLTYRNDKRTLKSEEVDKAHQEVLKELKKNLDVNFR